MIDSISMEAQKYLRWHLRTPEVSWLIVGSDGKDLPELPNVAYLGQVDYAAMDEIYKRVTVPYG